MRRQFLSPARTGAIVMILTAIATVSASAQTIKIGLINSYPPKLCGGCVNSRIGRTDSTQCIRRLDKDSYGSIQGGRAGREYLVCDTVDATVLAYVSVLDEISQLTHHRGAWHSNGLSDLHCGHGRAA
jgi:hypothetical protein